MHHSALHSHFDTSIFMEHSITIRYSITVSIYCHIDMYRRSLGVTTNDILKAADWSSESVFRKFYYRPTHNPLYGRAVLSKGSDEA